nr:hypothetical protein BgiMline_024742 [Biomphalaria glabrata]
MVVLVAVVLVVVVLVVVVLVVVVLVVVVLVVVVLVEEIRCGQLWIGWSGGLWLRSPSMHSYDFSLTFPAPIKA